MTDFERDVYILLCICGRSKEAEEYRLKCESSSKSDSTDEPNSKDE